MKAVVCKNKEFSVVDRPDPKPGKGQVLLKVSRCGICGSDLHVRKHCDRWGQIMLRSGYRSLTRTDEEVIFGHEFSGEVLDYGSGTRKSVKPGTPVVALPVLRRGDEIDLIGLSEHTTGAYAECTVVEESLMMPIPNGLSPQIAALTEPMSVGWHAVRRAELKNSDVAVVIGCGPVGLAIICMLKARGIKIIVAS
ncbi:MAG TPA: alcohol dehydrogenase catalytic domain-containing protein, partial [Burkholderiaceae bacterium]|nr:alcohol dehydrogenase catalytic domain-containing protein [Burkholderiaceae bacterium]